MKLYKIFFFEYFPNSKWIIFFVFPIFFIDYRSIRLFMKTVRYQYTYGTTTWFKFTSSLVRSESNRRTLVCRWSIVFPFWSIGSTLLTFFVWKFLQRKIHWKISIHAKKYLLIEYVLKNGNLASFITVIDANKMPILAPANTSHQWWRWSVIRDKEHKNANNKITLWIIGIKRRLRISGERICRYLGMIGKMAKK